MNAARVATRTALIERTAMAASRLGIVPPPFPAPFFDAYVAPMAARVVMAATRLGVIAALADEPDDAGGLARRLDLDAGGVDTLLAALVTLGYVRRGRDGRHRPTRVARRWLVPGGAQTQATWIGEFAYESWDHFGHLERALRGGEPIGLHDRPADDPYWEHYQRGLAEVAVLSADVVALAIPARRPERLIDLAGGHGRYAQALCRRHPSLHATVVELPAPVRIGRERIANAGLADRVEYLEGDLFELPLEASAFDIATAHSVLHNLTPERCVDLLRRAHAALRPDGIAAVMEIERPPAGHAGSRLATLAGVLFHILDRTRTYTAAELTGFMREAGFERVRVKRPMRLPGTVLLLGEKRPGR
jgi:SAM-dependent methyltransferase